MLLLMAVYAFLNELKQHLIKPDCIITVEVNRTGDGLRFNFYWIEDNKKIDIHSVIPYEVIRSIHDNQVAINWMVDEVNKELQKKFNEDLFNI